MATPILDKYLSNIHPVHPKKEPVRPAPLVQREPIDEFHKNQSADWQPVSAQQLRLLVVAKDRQTLQAHRMELTSGQAYAARGRDGQLEVRQHHLAADTFVQFDSYFRGGESARDTREFLQGEGEGARKRADELYTAVRHPVSAAHNIRKSLLESAPAIVAFPENHNQVLLDAGKAHLAALTDAAPRKAGQAWGGDLFDVGAAVAPMPSARMVFRGLGNAVTKPTLRAFENSSFYRFTPEGAEIGRNTARLRPSDLAEARNYLAEHYPEPKGGIHYYNTVVRDVNNTQYCTITDSLHLTRDIKPNPLARLGTSTANTRVSLKGCLAHEMEGHRRAFLAGKTQGDRLLEEAQASIRAARFGKGLSRTERTTLLRDAIARLQKQGVKIRDVKEQLWITNR